mmetsp:Transcript_18185/g.41062  ORF Transcript_18185/g.41062 Transcript_18185/m.41062 type:complete len:476 (+) Transcript_18185:95-1522(+)
MLKSPVRTLLSFRPHRCQTQDQSRRLFRHIDLRFQDPKDEQNFRRSLETEVLYFDCIGKGICAICVLLFLLWCFWWEVDKEDDRFNWEADDPRTLKFALDIFLTALLGSSCLLSYMGLRTQRHWKVNWETVIFSGWVVSSLLEIIGNRWYLTTLCGKDPLATWETDPRGDWVVVPLTIDMGVTLVCLLIPIRCCIVWALPTLTIGTVILLDTFVGSPFPAVQPFLTSLLIVLSLFALFGANRQERHTRQEWMAMHQVRASQAIVEEQDKQIEEQKMEIDELNHGQMTELPNSLQLTPSTAGSCQTECGSRPGRKQRRASSGCLGTKSATPFKGEICRLHGTNGLETGPLDGKWQAVDPLGRVSPWLASFRILGPIVIDGTGKVGQLHRDGQDVLLAGGKLIMTGSDLMTRVKPTSIIEFQRIVESALVSDWGSEASSVHSAPVSPRSTESEYFNNVLPDEGGGGGSAFREVAHQS